MIPFCFEIWPAGRLKLGNQHPTTMISIYSLADLLESMKKFEEAEELFREELVASHSPSMLTICLFPCVRVVIPGLRTPHAIF